MEFPGFPGFGLCKGRRGRKDQVCWKVDVLCAHHLGDGAQGPLAGGDH